MRIHVGEAALKKRMESPDTAFYTCMCVQPFAYPPIAKLTRLNLDTYIVMNPHPHRSTQIASVKPTW